MATLQININNSQKNLIGNVGSDCVFSVDGNTLTQQMDFTIFQGWYSSLNLTGPLLDSYEVNGNGYTIKLDLNRNVIWNGLVGNGNHSNIKIIGNLNELIYLTTGIIAKNEFSGTISQCSIVSTENLNVLNNTGCIAGELCQGTITDCTVTAKQIIMGNTT